MACVLCHSNNESVYPAEINIHFPGMKGLDKPTVWAFPRLLVCLDCGATYFTLSSAQVHQLRGDACRSDNAAA